MSAPLILYGANGYTGRSLASALAIASVLHELGLKPQPSSLLRKAISNSRGETVGEMRVNGGLER